MYSLNEFFADSGLLAFVTDRSVDFSLSSVKPSLSNSQKESLSRYADQFINEVALLKQIHGNDVVLVTKDFLVQYSLKEADGLVTAEPDVPLTIRTADCLPVFIFDPVQRAIGLAHAGWRGSRKRIIRCTLGKMKAQWGSNPGDLKVAFGPSIRGCCYKVGPEFKHYFPSETIFRGKDLYLNLSLFNKHQLLDEGVIEENIFDSGICTCCDERWFSYRREGEKAGRMISLMMLRSALAG